MGSFFAAGHDNVAGSAVIPTISGTVVFVALAAWIVGAKGAGLESLNGSLQRIFVGTWLLWMSVASVNRPGFSGGSGLPPVSWSRITGFLMPRSGSDVARTLSA